MNGAEGGPFEFVRHRRVRLERRDDDLEAMLIALDCASDRTRNDDRNLTISVLAGRGDDRSAEYFATGQAPTPMGSARQTSYGTRRSPPPMAISMLVYRMKDFGKSSVTPLNVQIYAPIHVSPSMPNESSTAAHRSPN